MGAWPDGPEIVLPAGDVTEGVVRIGDTVRRPHQATSVAVTAYLEHLESVGFPGAPRCLGRDEQGRDVLSFVDGAAAGDPPEPWAATGAVPPGVGRLVRALHDASAGWVPQVAMGAAIALIDFDLVGWTTRSVDLANTAMHWVPLRDPRDRHPVYDGVDVVGRLRLLIDGYGTDAVTGTQVLDPATLRFGASYESMRWNAEHLGGGWARMWEEGVGELIRRRAEWFAEVRDVFALALGG